MQKLKNFIIKHKVNLTILSALVLFFVFTIFTANAGDDEIVGGVLSGIVDEVHGMVISLIGVVAMGVAGLLGAVLSFFMTYLVDAASYDGFANAPAITTGWVLMRDLANMGIVIGLLIIAFGSAFSDSYELSKGLVKLLTTAIIVNFSKLITLFLIDISQVVMLSFVNSFRDVGIGNIISILGVEKFFDPNVNPDVTIVSALMSIVATIFLLVVAIGTIFVLTVTLVTRIVYLWILIVMAPMAFAVDAIPVEKLKSINSKWWETFVNYLIIGPFLAFFIWLTFVSLSGANAMKSNLTPSSPAEKKERMEMTQDTAALGKIGEYDQLAGFVIAIVMLLGGLKMSSEVAGSAGQMASNWGESSQGYVKKLAESAKKGLEARVYNGNFVPQRFQKFVPKVVQQGLTSVARLATERGRSEASELLQARVEKAAGGAASAGVVDEVKEAHQATRQKDLDTQQVMNNKTDFSAYLKQVIAKGDAGAVRAAIAEGSKKWGISQEDWDSAKPLIAKDFGSDKKGLTEFALDIQKENKKHGNPIDTTDQVINEEGNVVTNTLSKNDRMQKIIGDLNSDEMKKYMGRTDAFEGKPEEVSAKVAAMAENTNMVGKLTSGERKKMRENIEKQRDNKDYWDSLTAEQKGQHEKLYEAAGAEYDSEGRREEVDEYYEEKDRTGKMVVKSRKVKSTGQHLEATRSKEPLNYMAKRLKNFGDRMNDKKLSDVDRAQARKKYEETKKEHDRMQAIVKEQEKITQSPTASDVDKNKAEGIIKATIDKSYGMNYEKEKVGQESIDEASRIRTSDELKKGIIDGIAEGLSSALDAVGTAGSAVAGVPGDLAYGALSAFQNVGAEAYERTQDVVDSKEKKELAAVAADAQQISDVTFDPTDVASAVNTAGELIKILEEVARASVAALGARANEKSGKIVGNRDITRAELIEMERKEAVGHVTAFAGAPNDANKSRTARESTNEFILSNTGSKESQRKYRGMRASRNSQTRTNIGKAGGSIQKMRKSTDATAVNQGVEAQIQLMETALQEAQDNGADQSTIKLAREAVEKEATLIRNMPDFKGKLDRLESAMKVMGDALYTGALYGLKPQKIDIRGTVDEKGKLIAANQPIRFG